MVAQMTRKRMLICYDSCSVAWAELRIVTARIFSTYETMLGQDYFVTDEAGNETPKEIDEDQEEDLFPAGWFEPICLKKVQFVPQ